MGRLWRAVAARDWAAAETQLHPGAVIEWPHDARRFVTAGDLLAAWRASPEGQAVEVREIATQTKTVAVLATIRRDEQTLHCAAFYELHDGRIARGTEVWAPQA